MRKLFVYIIAFCAGCFCSAQYINRFNVETWLNQGGYNHPNHVQCVAGDFNADSYSDLALIRNDGGYATIDVFLSNGTSLTKHRWATRQGGFWDLQQWVAGDFNGDGCCDLANVFGDGGMASIDVHLSTGSSFGIQRWATRQGGFWNLQPWVTGDFTGDGLCDIAHIFNDCGAISIDIHPSIMGSFEMQRWATRIHPYFYGQSWRSGDFNGDGSVDLVNMFRDNTNYSIDVHINTGNSFAMERWFTCLPTPACSFLVGNFDGDNCSDVVTIVQVTKPNTLGSDLVPDCLVETACYLSNGIQHTFIPQLLDQVLWPTGYDRTWGHMAWANPTGDFNGDGLTDIAYVWSDGSIQIYLNTGQFLN